DQTGSKFNRYLTRNALPSRAIGGPELPWPDGFNCFFIQPQAGTLDHLDVGRAAVERNHNHQHNYALILRLARFVRVLRVRAVNAARHTYAINSSSKRAAAGSATLTRAKSAP